MKSPNTKPLSRMDYMRMSPKERIANFAAANGWTYNVKITSPNDATYAPAIAGLSDHVKISESFKGEWDGRSFVSYKLSCRLPGRETEKRYAVRVFRLDFADDVLLPHVFVSCQTSNRRSYLSVVPRRFSQSQKLSLEAAFGDNFTAYSHTGAKTDAVSFLPPNVLATMIDTNQRFDIELVGNSLYLYSDDSWAGEDTFKEAFRLMEGLSKHIEHRLKTWRFVLPNDTYPYMGSTPGYGDLVMHRRRFDALSALWLIVYTLALLRIWTADSVAETTTAKLLLTLLLALTVAAGVFITTRRSTKTKS